MRLSFDRKQEARAKPSPPPAASGSEPTSGDWEWLALANSEAMNWATANALLVVAEDRLRDLYERLDDERLKDHPDWGKAWHRSVLLEIEAAEHRRTQERCRARIEGVLRMLSPAGLAHVHRVWGADPVNHLLGVYDRFAYPTSLEVPF